GFKTLSFDAIKAIVYGPYCYKCHSSKTPGGPKKNINLEVLGTSAEASGDIHLEVQTDSMPPKGEPAMPDFAKVVLYAWLDAKAPETSDIPLPDPSSKPPPPPPPPPPGFDQISNVIFQPYCKRCHAEISSYDFVSANLEKIREQVKTNAMPDPKKPLSD